MYQQDDDVPIKVDIPHMLGGQRTHGLQETQLGVGSLFCRRIDIGRAGIGSLGEGGQPPGEHAQARTGSHDCRSSSGRHKLATR